MPLRRGFVAMTVLWDHARCVLSRARSLACCARYATSLQRGGFPEAAVKRVITLSCSIRQNIIKRARCTKIGALTWEGRRERVRARLHKPEGASRFNSTILGRKRHKNPWIEVSRVACFPSRRKSESVP